MREFSNIRRVNDWVRLLTLIALTGTVGGLAWALIGYPMQWADNTRRLNKLEPTILGDEQRITTLETNNIRMQGDMRVIVAQYQDIKEDLQYLRHKADR